MKVFCILIAFLASLYCVSAAQFESETLNEFLESNQFRLTHGSTNNAALVNEKIALFNQAVTENDLKAVDILISRIMDFDLTTNQYFSNKIASVRTLEPEQLERVVSKHFLPFYHASRELLNLFRQNGLTRVKSNYRHHSEELINSPEYLDYLSTLNELGYIDLNRSLFEACSLDTECPPRVIEHLVRLGADIEAEVANSFSSLDRVLHYQALDKIEAMYRGGADMRTALFIARRKAHLHEIAAYLESQNVSIEDEMEYLVEKNLFNYIEEFIKAGNAVTPKILKLMLDSYHFSAAWKLIGSDIISADTSVVQDTDEAMLLAANVADYCLLLAQSSELPEFAIDQLEHHLKRILSKTSDVSIVRTNAMHRKCNFPHHYRVFLDEIYRHIEAECDKRQI